MKIKGVILGVVLVSAILTMHCSKNSEYHRLVKKGLASGERQDTLFLGLYLGMTSQDFYSQCWEMNKRGLIRQGAGNTSVLYEMKDALKADIDVHFYPTFFEDKIYEMPVTFRYKAWAPWNQQFSEDTLQTELLGLFEDWYGKGFIELHHPDRGLAYVKVDGNRRISIYKSIQTDGTVRALYTDMSVDEEARKLVRARTEKSEEK